LRHFIVKRAVSTWSRSLGRTGTDVVELLNTAASPVLLAVSVTTSAVSRTSAASVRRRTLTVACSPAPRLRVEGVTPSMMPSVSLATSE
jgi:hypothetical protein